MIVNEGVGRVCTDDSVDTLLRLAGLLLDDIAGGGAMGLRCKALSARLFSPVAAVRQVVAALSS